MGENVATCLGRFQIRLVEHHLWDKLLVDINRQLEAKSIITSEGRINIIDAIPLFINVKATKSYDTKCTAVDSHMKSQSIALIVLIQLYLLLLT
ncbi:MAG: hypothetical protein KAG53_07530 [Endozoicomonadaceae bacterium]|nr:hypothetical protein [Endozoicomonadaceae bacterium]